MYAAGGWALGDPGGRSGSSGVRGGGGATRQVHGRGTRRQGVSDHPAYAAAVEQLGKYTVEELDDKAFPVPDVPVP